MRSERPIATNAPQWKGKRKLLEGERIQIIDGLFKVGQVTSDMTGCKREIVPELGNMEKEGKNKKSWFASSHG